MLQYVITYQEVMTHTRAYRARPRSEKLSAAEAVETNPGKTMPADEHKSLGAVLNLKRHNLWVHQPKIWNRAMSQTSQRHSANYDISDLIRQRDIQLFPRNGQARVSAPLPRSAFRSGERPVCITGLPCSS